MFRVINTFLRFVIIIFRGVCQVDLLEFALFLLSAIGEKCGSLTTKKNDAEILQAISGFFSLLICFSQNFK